MTLTLTVLVLISMKPPARALHVYQPEWLRVIESSVKVTRVLLEANSLSLLSYQVTLTAAKLDAALHTKSMDFPSSMNEPPLMLIVIGSIVKSVL